MNRFSEAQAAPDVIAALRAATGARHARLDSALPLAAPDATLADYASHLQLLQGWLAPLGAWLTGFDDGPQTPGLLAPSAHLARIAGDLAEPALAPWVAATPATAASSPWPQQASPAWRWGVAYVVEGAQLGGAVLYQRLAAQLAPHPLSYLRGAGTAGPGPRWRAFMLALRAHVTTDEDCRQACAGACAAFDALLERAFPAQVAGSLQGV